MEDSTFLQQALKQSFYLPEFKTSDSLVAEIKPFAEGFFFREKYCRSLNPVFLSQAQIRKYTALVKNDLKHNQQLEREYLLYKHDMEENVIIPTDFTPAKEFISKYYLREVNRKNARKKNIIASFFPADFRQKFAAVFKSHQHDMLTAQSLFETHKVATGFSVLKDFTVLYKQTLKQTDFKHFLLWLNKKRFRFYLNEAAQILKTCRSLPDDFLQTHIFWGGKSAVFCTFRFALLLELLQKLAGDKKLLGLVQLLLADPQKYRQALNKYKTVADVPYSVEINDLRQSAQKLSSAYARLNYLNAVISAFEYDFLNKCPAAKNLPLPTVSPQDELREVQKIITESLNINSADKNLNKLCIKALSEYQNSRGDFCEKLKIILNKTQK